MPLPPLPDWITFEAAAKLHPHVTAKRIEAWTENGCLAADENRTRIYLPMHRLGGRLYTTEHELMEFLTALEPGADPVMIRRLAR